MTLPKEWTDLLDEFFYNKQGAKVLSEYVDRPNTWNRSTGKHIVRLEFDVETVAFGD